jgi:hypothetical protein
MKKNYVAVVLDNSASMSSISRSAADAFNGIVGAIRDEAKASAQKTRVTYLTFGERVTTQFFNADASTLSPMSHDEYRPNESSTALFDGVGRAIELLDEIKIGPGDDAAFLVQVVTDGENNRTLDYTYSRIADLIRRKQATDRWSFAFLVPPRKAQWFSTSFGIPIGNIREWEATDEGVRNASVATQSGIGTYFAARSVGHTRVDNFYVQTDASKVTTRKLASQLDDVSDRFKSYDVPTEQPIKDFIERRTKRPYVVGCAYYQLMKTETVQPQKGVLIAEKTGGRVWAGMQARELIGIPAGRTAKVTPGNHAAYDIFVQSTSVNRRLPRGTKVMWDSHMVNGVAPTWAVA